MFKAQHGFFETIWIHICVLLQGIFWHMYVMDACMFVCIFVDMYVCVGVGYIRLCACVCGRPKLTLGGFPSYSSLFSLIELGSLADSMALRFTSLASKLT